VSELDLLSRHCVEYPAGTPVFPPAEVERYLTQTPGWEVVEGKLLRLRHRCRGFSAAIEFVNGVAEIAKAENHHPDLRVYSHRWVEVELTTHSIGGLSPNDFILAAKINRLLATS
jgi:4a-hydroxytetrahydrobiopterin dehydratase